MGKIIFRLLLLAILGGTIYFFVYKFPIMNSSSQRGYLLDADEIYIYEGLLDQSEQDNVFAKDRKKADTRVKSGFDFYSLRLKLNDKKTEELKDILASSASYKLHTKKKEGGDFYADFGVFWRVERKEFSLLICFASNEIKIIDGGKTHHYDMAYYIEEELKDILIPISKKRSKSLLKQ